MKLKNAGFEDTEESRKEAMKRMTDGEVFNRGKVKLFFDISCVRAGLSGFRCKYPEERVNHPIHEDWHSMTEWQVEVDWKESLSPENPRWCKVWRTDNEIFYTRVYGFVEATYPEKSYYITYSVVGIYHAEPAPDELAAMLEAEVGK